MATRMASGAVRTPGGSNSSGASSSFQDYQESVSDAWDLGDDEFCIISGVVDTPRISKKVSQSAALNVIKTHRTSGSGEKGRTVVEAMVCRGIASDVRNVVTGSDAAVVENLDGLKICKNLGNDVEGNGVYQHEELNNMTDNR